MVVEWGPGFCWPGWLNRDFGLCLHRCWPLSPFTFSPLCLPASPLFRAGLDVTSRTVPCSPKPAPRSMAEALPTHLPEECRVDGRVWRRGEGFVNRFGQWWGGGQRGRSGCPALWPQDSASPTSALGHWRLIPSESSAPAKDTNQPGRVAGRRGRLHPRESWGFSSSSFFVVSVL